MAIKDDIKTIKEELNTQEQFLESIIKSERFFKKYKTLIIATFVILILGAIGYYTNKFLHQMKIDKANDAYSKLILDPNDTEAIETLKKNAPSLHALFEFKSLNEKNNLDAIKALANEPVDPVLKEFFKFSAGENSELGADYDNLIKGFKLLKEDKISEANMEFAKIPQDSALQNIVQNLQHYQGYKK